MDQNEDEDGLLKFFKEPKWIFTEFLNKYINRWQCKLQTEPDLKARSGAQNLQMAKLVFFHKSDPGTSHDFYKFLWNL